MTFQDIKRIVLWVATVLLLSAVGIIVIVSIIAWVSRISSPNFDQEQSAPDKELAQVREEGKKLCDEYEYPPDPLGRWKEDVLKMFVICKNAENTEDYINVTYLLKELNNPSSEYSPTIEFKEVNDISLIVLNGISTSNYYLFFDKSADGKEFSDLLVDNGRRGSPIYRIVSDSFGNQWFVSTKLNGGGSDMSDFIDSWYWINKSLKLSKVLEYGSLGGFGTGWGMFNDPDYLVSSFSVKESPKTIGANSYIDFVFSRSYAFGDQDLVSDNISMRYRWNSTTKSFEYISGDSGFKLENIDGDGAPLFGVKVETEECDVNWLLCMNVEFIKENYSRLIKIATGSDIDKKKALGEFLIKNSNVEISTKQKQELDWFHNLPQVKQLLSYYD